MAVVQNERVTRAGGVVENAGEGGRKTKPLQHREKIRMSYPIVGLLLV
jgi:hypothetical protein